ncbi:sigma-54-dependent transcriptional regulator [Desulfatirhabdium butyrativorans]|uniref:sigma-54-dependent transcriptional regulator n=1 Tax=Desulfatirhabdium butyrativorans TaxID=340467 RepID=UPI0003F603FE|nr:sigma-54 dependent transcriptional regulator [Desulfatirhabdium butyrativorans]
MISIPEDASILVVDDDTGLLLSVCATLLSAGLPEPAVLSDSSRVMSLLRKHRIQVVMLDLVMPKLSGMAVLEAIKKEYPDIVCIIVTATDEVATAIQAIKLGAYDYLVKPVSAEDLIIVVRRALERYELRKTVTHFETRQSFSAIEHPEAFREMVAEDESMALVFRQVEAVAPTDYSVIISGESGTGKEMLARILHRLSKRKDKPFVAVNMAAFNKSLFEDAFFGHAKGAYTHALDERKGFFETADGGTLFLDEITELDAGLQAKLLRVLQEKEFYRVGSATSRKIDVRIIAATNRDILNEVKEERFRADLFYRLSMYTIKVPPLRERRKDIVPLARYFVKLYGAQQSSVVTDISEELIRNLLNYSFPGNIRELENMIAGAVLLETTGTLQLSSVRHLPQRLPGPLPSVEADWPTLGELEKRYLARVLEKTGGNRKKAAEILGVNQATIYRKIEKLGLGQSG